VSTSFPESIPPQVDYTSRDYESIRTDLIARLQQQIPDWAGDDPTDFGVALVEQFAYLGDLLSYYIDRAANESTLSTATRRDSVVALARDLGYVPNGYTSSSVTVTFSNESDVDIELPARTVVSGDILDGDNLITVAFETDDDVEVLAGAIAAVSATQGVIGDGVFGFGMHLGTSDGTPNQVFVIEDDRLVLESLEVYVYDLVNYIPWARTDQFALHGPQARVFQPVAVGDGTVQIRLGDGVSGLIPAFGHSLSARYRRTDGTLGNIRSGTINRIDAIPGLLDSEVAVLAGSLTVFNDTAAYGGTDQESTEQIRNNAALTYRATARAVTLEDYQNSALLVPGCGKASAMSVTPASVVVAVSPYRGPETSELRPGYVLEGTDWIPTTELTSLQSSVQSALESVSLAGAQISVVPPVYVDTYISLDVVVEDSVRRADASILIRQTILSRMAYDRVPFGASIYPSDLVSLISSLGSVASDVQVIRLTTIQAATTEISVVVAAEDEILVVSDSNLVINLTGGVS
jgi:hypothetical protein